MCLHTLFVTDDKQQKLYIRIHDHDQRVDRLGPTTVLRLVYPSVAFQRLPPCLLSLAFSTQLRALTSLKCIYSLLVGVFIVLYRLSLRLAVDAEALDEHMSSSLEDDDDMTPASDEEIDELEEETEEGEEDYDEGFRTSKKSADTDSVGMPDESALEDEVKTSDTAKLGPGKTKGEKSRKPSGTRKRIERHDKRIDLGLLDHKAHPDCPDTLACLPDTHGRPQHTLPVILRCAILGSLRKRLTIREIYATMEAKYPYYKTAGQTWKVKM